MPIDVYRKYHSMCTNNCVDYTGYPSKKDKWDHFANYFAWLPSWTSRINTLITRSAWADALSIWDEWLEGRETNRVNVQLTHQKAWKCWFKWWSKWSKSKMVGSRGLGLLETWKINILRMRWIGSELEEPDFVLAMKAFSRGKRWQDWSRPKMKKRFPS